MMRAVTPLKTIEPYRLKALIIEDLKFHPESLLSEIATRLPDVDFPELGKMVRNMAKDGEISFTGGRMHSIDYMPLAFFIDLLIV